MSKLPTSLRKGIKGVKVPLPLREGLGVGGDENHPKTGFNLILFLLPVISGTKFRWKSPHVT
jgi:hypothetical protein